MPGSLMIVLRRDNVDDLNRRARAGMLAGGRLTGSMVVTTGGLQLRAGHRIVCLRNDRQLGVVNGTRAAITRIHLDTDEVASLTGRLRRSRAEDRSSTSRTRSVVLVEGGLLPAALPSRHPAGRTRPPGRHEGSRAASHLGIQRRVPPTEGRAL